MFDPGRYEGEDSDGGCLDGRRWLKRENRRFEASVAADDRGPFPEKWGGENAETSRGFALYEDNDLSVVVWKLEMAGDGRSEERDALGYATVSTLARYTGAVDACDPLDI